MLFPPFRVRGVGHPARRQNVAAVSRGNGETVRVFGRPEELAERLEASGCDIPASEIEAGMELHLPCLVKVGQGHKGYKNIEEFSPEAAAPSWEMAGCAATDPPGSTIPRARLASDSGGPVMRRPGRPLLPAESERRKRL